MSEQTVIEKNIGITHPCPSQEGNVSGLSQEWMLEEGSAELVVKEIMDRLKAFDAAIEASEILEIDGLAINGQACEKISQESRVKVLNHYTEAAYEVEIDTIIQTPTKALILALETGIFVKCHGITRIVGYYSRVHNWNSSKIAELKDRRQGNYWEKKRVNTEKIAVDE
jgi:hypothetical protein